MTNKCYITYCATIHTISVTAYCTSCFTTVQVTFQKKWWEDHVSADLGVDGEQLGLAGVMCHLCLIHAREVLCYVSHIHMLPTQRTGDVELLVDHLVKTHTLVTDSSNSALKEEHVSLCDKSKLFSG